MKLAFKNKRENALHKTGISKVGLSLYRHVQRRWVSWMAKHTVNFSRRTWKLILILFMLFAGGYNAYLIVSGLLEKANKPFSLARIKKPGHVIESGDGRAGKLLLSQTEYARIRKFRIYLDSLARSPSGKVLYDSIAHSRPGLIDSVHFIERHYRQLEQK